MTDSVLICDDETDLREMLAEYLGKRGFQTSLAGNAEELRATLEVEKPDLILLDINMPGEDGLSVLRSLQGPDAPHVIMLTAAGEVIDRVVGLEMGADDYLAKPFEPKELLLRINAILRRMPDATADDAAPKLLTLGDIRYDIERGEMWRGEDLVRLTATESQLMRIFSAQPGEPLSRTKLVEELGRDRGQSQERAVDVQITRLRRKIEDDPKQPRYLQTVRGAGYILAPD